jgi:hypothetical protein
MTLMPPGLTMGFIIYPSKQGAEERNQKAGCILSGMRSRDWEYGSVKFCVLVQNLKENKI